MGFCLGALPFMSYAGPGQRNDNLAYFSVPSADGIGTSVGPRGPGHTQHRLQYPIAEKGVDLEQGGQEILDRSALLDKSLFVWEDPDTENKWITCLTVRRDHLGLPPKSFDDSLLSGVFCQEINLNHITKTDMDHAKNYDFAGPMLKLYNDHMCIYASTLIGRQCSRVVVGGSITDNNVSRMSLLLQIGHDSLNENLRQACRRQGPPGSGPVRVQRCLNYERTAVGESAGSPDQNQKRRFLDKLLDRIQKKHTFQMQTSSTISIRN